MMKEVFSAIKKKVRKLQKKELPLVNNEPTGFQSTEHFDLETFFGDEPKTSTFVKELQQQSYESIVSFSTKISSNTFAQGLSMTSQIFSSLGNIIGSCGVVCSHSLGAVANAGSSLSSLGGVSGSMGGFNFDGKGNVSFNGNIGELARRTGLSSSDITLGKYSTEDLLTLLIQSFGKGIENVMGIGLIHCVLDGFIPTPVRSSD